MNHYLSAIALTSFFAISAFGAEEGNVLETLIDCKAQVSIEGTTLSGSYKIFSLDGQLSAEFKMLTPMEEEFPTIKTSNVFAQKINQSDFKQVGDDILNEVASLASVDLSVVKTLEIYTIEPNDDGGAASIYLFRDEKNSELGKAGQFGWFFGKCL